ncbi:LysR family transcriptional regulator for bpeEF and oprC [Trinickia symbiotica]|uniref:LysR family transcriptional regulator n=1 Tax=Trinickia symbiotica TaxID=863227 RepID=A0A2N7WTD6_9BURK|nr:LysR family transcriptional regulator [Trinickia symbiotica]PMS32644.1 LysR family transcriptional regulator [Trinickia symbiotica]PPK41752.1 LysR family transcriptional regulator for bpeEF and oprC [Trinickia symbiotica]
MDKLRAMEAFVQVVDAGGFTRAADNMRLPKAKVSTVIRDLEAALGVKLLTRTTRRMHLTTDGAAYYQTCVHILSEIRDAEDALLQSHASPSGRVRVDVPSFLGRRVLIPALPEFLARYPRINIDVGLSDREFGLLEEGVDCALRGGAQPDSTLIAKPVGLLRFVISAAPSYLSGRGRPMHPRDLMNHECVNYFSPRTGKIFEWEFMRNGERTRIAVPGRVAVNDTDAYFDACRAGMGIGHLPMYGAADYIESGELVPLLEDWTVVPSPLFIVYPQNRHLSAKTRTFVDWLSELYREQDSLRKNDP